LILLTSFECQEALMAQVTARLPDDLTAELEAAAQQLNRCRADVIRQAIEYYLDDIEDLRCGVAALKDPADPVLNWAEVRDALLSAD
jgi:transposase